MKGGSYRRDLDALCEEYGFVIRRVTGSGHYQLTHPSCTGCITAAYSASDHRALKNIRALMRRMLSTTTSTTEPHNATR